MNELDDLIDILEKPKDKVFEPKHVESREPGDICLYIPVYYSTPDNALIESFR